MNQTVPTQHPAVVLRSHYLHLRALLVIATVAVVGLTIAVVVLATTTNRSETIAAPSVRVTPPAVTARSGARLDHRGISSGTSGSLGTPASAASCGDVCSSHRQVSTIAATPTPASAASCGDVCSSHRQVSTIAATPTPASAASCGDVCSSHRQVSTIAATPTPASAASCGDVCSSHRQAR